MSPHRNKLGRLAAGLLAFGTMVPAHAYTSAGDRIFPATILLPQIAPTDEFYLTGATLPTPGAQSSALTANYAKTLTPDIAIDLSEGYSWTNPDQGPATSGWQNTALAVTWQALELPTEEFLLSGSLVREFGGTGAVHAGAQPLGATTAFLFFGKGFGSSESALVKPFAVAGALGYALGDGRARPDQIQFGLALEYSLPYFAATARGMSLPAWLGRITPLVELYATTPEQTGGGTTTLLIGPGFDYADDGWELGVEALVPATRATGSGAGVSVQLHLALDYLLPGTLGRPVF